MQLFSAHRSLHLDWVNFLSLVRNDKTGKGVHSREVEQQCSMERSTVVGHRKGSGIGNNPFVIVWDHWWV